MVHNGVSFPTSRRLHTSSQMAYNQQIILRFLPTTTHTNTHQSTKDHHNHNHNTMPRLSPRNGKVGQLDAKWMDLMRQWRLSKEDPRRQEQVPKGRPFQVLGRLQSELTIGRAAPHRLCSRRIGRTIRFCLIVERRRSLPREVS